MDFYRGFLGFKLHWREGNRAGLGAGGETSFNSARFPQQRAVSPTLPAFTTLRCCFRIKGSLRAQLGGFLNCVIPATQPTTS